MVNQGDLKALPDPESLALRIATKSAFLASRTAKDAAISTLAQQSAEHTRLQEIHRDLIAQLAHKENQILDLRDIAAKAQTISTEKELELQHAAESARSTLSQEEAEHARLKERYRDCIAKLERKDAEIVGLHSKIEALSKKHNDVDHAAYVALKEHELELRHVRTFFEERDAELEEKSTQIEELDGTNESLTRECSELKESEAGLQKVLDKRIRDLEHATDAAAFSQTQNNAEKRRLQDLLHEQTKQIEAKDIQIFELQETSENLAQENSNLKSQAARVNDALSAVTQDLKQVTTDAFAKITASKIAADQRVAGLTATIGALENDALHSKKQLRDAARTQSQTEAKRRDAVDMMLKVQAASDQLKRDNALLSAEVGNLQTRKESLARNLANSSEEHAKTKDELRNATKTISGLTTSEAEARGAHATSAARIEQLQFDKNALQMRLENLPRPVMGVSYQIQGMQNPPLPVQASWIRDDSDLYDWNAAKASGWFDCWANNLHGSEIMPLLSIEKSQDDMVAFVSKLLFPQGTHRLVGWLTRGFQDQHLEQWRLRIVHVLNDTMSLYGCTCHRMHFYPNGSQDQDIHVRFALEALRVYGEFENACSLFVAILSCYNGRVCLGYLEECGIFLDRSERELLTQRCQDKLRGVVS